MGGKVCKLVLVAKHNPEVYKKFLQNVSAGCSLASSAAAVGMSPKGPGLVLSKTKKGVASKEEKKIARDIMRALGGVLGLTEAELRKQDPKYWLKYGPGKYITDEWNDDNTIISNNNDIPASNSISSKDVTDALIQLYKCGISIDQLIESGQINSLQLGGPIGAESKMSAGATQPVPTLPALSDGGPGAVVLYGESSYTPQSNPYSQTHSPTPLPYAATIYGESSYGFKESSSSPDPESKVPYNPALRTEPPKLLVANQPAEIVDSITPERKATRRTPRQPVVSEPYSGPSYPLSQESSGVSIDFYESSRYDGPTVKQVHIQKVVPDPQGTPPETPVLPEKKVIHPGRHPDEMREMKKARDVKMDEAVRELEVLPDGLREFLSKKGIV